ISPPAENARSPAATITTRVIAGSSPQASSCARSASTMAWVTALSACGRLSVMRPAAPRRSKSISLIAASLPASMLRRPGAGGLQPLHGLIGELGARRVAADHEHQNRFRIRIALGDVLETADHAGRKRNHVERPEIDVIDLAVLVFPTGAPGAGHRDEGFVGVVIVHLGAVSRRGLAIAEIETLADLYGGHYSCLRAHRRSHATLPDVVRRLKAEDVEQRALAALHLAVGQSAVETFQVLEAGDALHHLVARQIKSRQLFHRFLLIF